MTRQEAREYMMTIAFQMDILNDFDVDKDYIYLNRDMGKQREYCEEVFSLLCNKKEEIDKSIQENCIKWSVARMPKTDIAILRVAVSEILYLDVPESVSVNEAVELAKKYGVDNSPSYINGILGSIVRNKEKR